MSVVHVVVFGGRYRTVNSHHETTTSLSFDLRVKKERRGMERMKGFPCFPRKEFLTEKTDQGANGKLNPGTERSYCPSGRLIGAHTLSPSEFYGFHRKETLFIPPPLCETVTSWLVRYERVHTSKSQKKMERNIPFPTP